MRDPLLDIINAELHHTNKLLKELTMEDWKVVRENVENNIVIQKMVNTNSIEYNVDKAIEELLELAEALMKRKLKGDKGATQQDVIDEIGDVQIRINVLKELMGPEAVENRINAKLTKFRGFYEQSKYVGHI
jgi:NTP pyrophosphatase (non-canonical NTP hydrolase)